MIVKLEREGRHLEDLPIVSASQTGIRWPPVPRPRTPFLARSHRGLHSPAFAAPIPPHALYNNGRAPPPSIPTLNCARFADLADDLAYVFAPPSLLGAVVCDVRSISQLKQVQITLETWRNSCQQSALGTFPSLDCYLPYVHKQKQTSCLRNAGECKLPPHHPGPKQHAQDVVLIAEQRKTRNRAEN